MPGRPVAGRPRRRAPDAPEDWTEPTPREIEQDARGGSFMLRVALLRYGAAHGLPNLPPAACKATLRQLAGSKEGRRALRLWDKSVAGRGRAASRPVRRARGAVKSREIGEHGTRG